MELSTSPPLPAQLSIADLHGFGERFGIDYHFPRQSAAARHAVVLRGSVQELMLPSGLHATHSRLDVLRPYETRSTGHTNCFLLVVLQGSVQLEIAARQYQAQAGTALIARLDSDTALRAFHGCGQHLQTLTLALDSRLGADAARWHDIALPARPLCHCWPVPAALLQSLRHWQARQASAGPAQRLMLEGLALQLLADGLQAAWPAEPASLSPGERERLEAIRFQLDHAPAQTYTVEQLADLAAMSVSSFRSKFRALFGAPVFHYLREQRLTLASHYLQQGYSVQQAAHLSGYGHATNFATAFRKRYGTSPSRHT
ncbi:helix-turn-helix transcriptional regulator [Bordetella trematum]|uniref:helix-turn-helix transcriptional regulator n=1 Tax=Bordetella trematum TaxID=123899 RepID=UPI000C75DE01|nr:AraC family transcriptional regulator [Bordetella trematum]